MRNNTPLSGISPCGIPEGLGVVLIVTIITNVSAHGPEWHRPEVCSHHACGMITLIFDACHT